MKYSASHLQDLTSSKPQINATYFYSSLELTFHRIYNTLKMKPTVNLASKVGLISQETIKSMFFL